MRTRAVRLAAALHFAVLPGAAGNADILARMAAGMEARIEAVLQAPSFEALGWEARADLARSFRAEAAPAWIMPVRPGLDWRPELRVAVTGPDYGGQARLSAAEGGTAGLAFGWFLRNAERGRAERYDRLSRQARDKAELWKQAALLDELKGALDLRNSLARLEAETLRRADFGAFLDSLLERLRPYAENLAVSPNSLNNLRVLREANAATLEYLRKEERLLLKGAREQALLDTADFLALDVSELVDSLEAARRRGAPPTPSYRHRADSVEAEMARHRASLDRQGDDRLWLGLEAAGTGPSRPEPGAGVGIRLEWSAAFGAPAAPAAPRPGSLPRPEIRPLDTGEAADMLARAERAGRAQREAVDARLAELRLGQTGSIYAINESLGYLLSQQLQVADFAHSLRRHSLSGIQSLEELGLPPRRTSP